MKPYSHLLSVSLIVFLMMFTPAMAGDRKGCGDHPLLSRYAGSEIVRCGTDRFDEYRLLTGKVNRAGKAPDIKIEGRINRITYKTPAERTTLEVLRNYESALKDADFEILYTCSDKDCGGRNFNHKVVPYSLEFAENYKDQRYLAAQLKREEETVYVSLYTARNTSSGGPTHNLVYTQLDIVEAGPMQGSMVKIDAGAMAKEISKTGHVALYGIYFDTDRSEIKPESGPTLEEIARLLRENRSLELVVVGHTDNQGSLDYNMDLSKRRAKAVVDSLAEDYGIRKSRLADWGVGYLSPVASNRTEEGRAKNRRVELVER